jgi:hypothetical protein
MSTFNMRADVHAASNLKGAINIKWFARIAARRGVGLVGDADWFALNAHQRHIQPMTAPAAVVTAVLPLTKTQTSLNGPLTEE